MERGPSRDLSTEGSDAFEREYWREQSIYRKFADYRQGLEQTKRWYAGLVRMVGGQLPAGGRHVDAGCGHGAIVEPMGERGLDSRGFDASAWMIDQARHAGMGDQLRHGYIEDGIPFDGAFDLVTCVEVLEHLEHPENALEVIAGRLKPGGRLIATTPNLRPRIPWNDPVASDPTHVNVHEPRWWAERLHRTSLAVREVSTFIAVPLLWRVSPRLSLWFRMGPQFGPGVLLIGERGAAGHRTR
jgi:2-polyprenyl-3-methyl-5-hydroxy-6-metoxy-1,4-benzoquinol methylase